MGPLEFAYWLRGFFEIGGERALSKEEVVVISKHLTLVFEEVAKAKRPISVDAIKKALIDPPAPFSPLDPRNRLICSTEKTAPACSVACEDDYDAMTGSPLASTVICSPKDSKAWDL